MAKRVSIQQIAHEADVSITTVSHALNGKGRIPEKTRERVRQVAERLGYRAHPQARGLKMGRSMTLAMQVGSPCAEELIPDFEYFVELLNTASATALELGYSLVLAPAGASAESLLQFAFDGVVVVDPTGEEALLAQTDVPVVTTGRIPGVLREGAWVDNDHRAGTRRVLEHFAEVGCSRPALLTTAAQQSYVEDAIAEYKDWCREREQEPLVSRIAGNPTEAAGEAVVGDLLSRHPRPDAIYATLDRIALGVLRASHDGRIVVPEDLAIAAVTDSLFLRSADPPITTLNLNASQIGRKATELLVALAKREEPSSTQVIVPSSLEIRNSTRRWA